MTVDYIIVGMGLAGLSFAQELKSQNKSFVVFENESQCSSLVAGGMYNPVILKRFTPVWNAKEQLTRAIPFYKKLEKELAAEFDQPIGILRTFKSIEEQNNWFAASDKPVLSEFMVPSLEKVESEYVIAPFKAGRLKHTGRIRVRKLITAYRNELIKNQALRTETFDYDLIQYAEDQVVYKDVKAGRIVFCEGNGIRNNPFFKYLPLTGTKGELINIHAPDLNIDYVLKSAVFIMPLGNHKYKIGATFNWSDKTNTPTKEGRKELESKLKTVLNCSYEVIDHEAGIRPTTGDRRPLLGVHHKYKRLAVLNGLGTRGVMIGPLMAAKLFGFLERKEPLDRDISIERFAKKSFYSE